MNTPAIPEPVEDVKVHIDENSKPLRLGEKERPANEQPLDCYCEAI